MDTFAVKCSINIVAIVFAFATGSSIAADPMSVYQKIDFEADCNAEEIADGFGLELRCSVMQDYVSIFSDEDARFATWFGLRDGFKRSSYATFQQFNDVNDIVEWRIYNEEPVATILRWFVVHPNKHSNSKHRRDREILVVSKVATDASTASCWVGLIDASATPDANELARKVADNVVPMFDCDTEDAKYFGNEDDQTPKFYNVRYEPADLKPKG